MAHVKPANFFKPYKSYMVAGGNLDLRDLRWCKISAMNSILHTSSASPRMTSKILSSSVEIYMCVYIYIMLSN